MGREPTEVQSLETAIDMRLRELDRRFSLMDKRIKRLEELQERSPDSEIMRG